MSKEKSTVATKEESLVELAETIYDDRHLSDEAKTSILFSIIYEFSHLVKEM